MVLLMVFPRTFPAVEMPAPSTASKPFKEPDRAFPICDFLIRLRLTHFMAFLNQFREAASGIRPAFDNDCKVLET